MQNFGLFVQNFGLFVQQGVLGLWKPGTKGGSSEGHRLLIFIFIGILIMDVTAGAVGGGDGAKVHSWSLCTNGGSSEGYSLLIFIGILIAEGQQELPKAGTGQVPV